MKELPVYNEAPIATAPNSALTMIVSNREVAEAQGAIVVAKKFPRNEIEAVDRILVACQRPALAEGAMYQYAKGGTSITGPSIRLAETMIRLWGNASYGIRELEQRPGESIIEAFAVDLETNVRQIKVFTVKHERTTKKGTYRLEDGRDIYENLANFGARRLRACILGLLPGDVIESAVNQCEETLKAKADTSPEALKKLVDAFAVLNVTKEQIEKRIQRRLDTITAAQLVQLRKVYNSMRDGMSGVADWFEIPEKNKPENSNLKDKLKANKKMEEIAAAPCPDNPETTYTKDHCDTCEKRSGCPAWG